jgi:ABC-2 type transport system ATP-binding protein
MNEPVLELKDVHKSYKRKPVLQGVDLQIPAGAVMGLLGKNGAGKTTLIKCALGLHQIDSGAAKVLGEPTWTLSAAAKERLGYVPQEIVLFSTMKVRQALAYTGAFYRNWNPGLVERLLRDWDLNPEARIGPLSVGQQQKLAIILALGHEPELLVLDEPAASLDPEARRQFLGELLQIAVAGERTVLFSTHITSDLERVANSVAVIRDGKVLMSGELESLKDSVKRLRISASTPFPSDVTDLLSALHPGNSPHGDDRGGGATLKWVPVIDGVVPRLLRQDIRGDQALLSIEGYSPELRNELARRWGADVSVEDLNLEDIFLELHHA